MCLLLIYLLDFGVGIVVERFRVRIHIVERREVVAVSEGMAALVCNHLCVCLRMLVFKRRYLRGEALRDRVERVVYGWSGVTSSVSGRPSASSHMMGSCAM
jgi:hypothetical protein